MRPVLVSELLLEASSDPSVEDAPCLACPLGRSAESTEGLRLLAFIARLLLLDG